MCLLGWFRSFARKGSGTRLAVHACRGRAAASAAERNLGARPRRARASGCVARVDGRRRSAAWCQLRTVTSSCQPSGVRDDDTQTRVPPSVASGRSAEAPQVHLDVFGSGAVEGVAGGQVVAQHSKHLASTTPCHAHLPFSAPVRAAATQTSPPRAPCPLRPACFARSAARARAWTSGTWTGAGRGAREV